MSIRIALYEPDIPQNTGAIIRLGACLGLPIDIIEPCGFLFSDVRLKRAGLDYMELAEVTRHRDWEAFLAARQGRIVLMTTRAALAYTEFAFHDTDILLLGRESAGVPESVHRAADIRLRVPLRPNARSLNVALTAALAAGEALRQIRQFELL